MRRVQGGLQPAPVHISDRRLRPAEGPLGAELVREIAGIDHIQSVSTSDLLSADETFTRQPAPM